MKPDSQPHKTFSLRPEPRLLRKGECIREAEEIIARGRISHMTIDEIAGEIYFHALVYHICLTLERFHLPFRRIKNMADPINLADYGDTAFRRFFFRLAWILPGRK